MLLLMEMVCYCYGNGMLLIMNGMLLPIVMSYSMTNVLQRMARVSYSLHQECFTFYGNSVLQFMAMICGTVCRTFWVI